MNLLYATAKLKNLETQLLEIDDELGTMPPGKITIAKNGTGTKWYINDSNGSRYLPKSNHQLARLLARKKYLLAKKGVLEDEQKALSQYSRYHHDNYPLLYDNLLTDPRYSSLLNMSVNESSTSIESWLNTPYEKNPNHPESLIHKTLSGTLVRSKSEVLIANLLSQRNIPFRYEYPLILEGHRLYPDFTLINPIDFQIWYLEHFGMMDDPQYVTSFSDKMKLYCRNNIIPDQNLIMTFESKYQPLDLNALDLKLSYIFGV